MKKNLYGLSIPVLITLMFGILLYKNVWNPESDKVIENTTTNLTCMITNLITIERAVVLDKTIPPPGSEVLTDNNGNYEPVVIKDYGYYNFTYIRYYRTEQAAIDRLWFVYNRNGKSWDFLNPSMREPNPDDFH